MKPLFNVGDKVRVINFDSFEGYPFGVNSQMCEYSEKTVTIASVVENAYNPDSHKIKEDGYKYCIKEDNGQWNWSSPMFELVEKSDLKSDSSKENLSEKKSSEISAPFIFTPQPKKPFELTINQFKITTHGKSKTFSGCFTR